MMNSLLIFLFGTYSVTVSKLDSNMQVDKAFHARIILYQRVSKYIRVLPETGSRFNVSSERPEKLGIDLAIPESVV